MSNDSLIDLIRGTKLETPYPDATVEQFRQECLALISKNKIGANGALIELLEYDEGWLPWRFCTRRLVEDGKDYQRPGQLTCTGWANHETLDEANKAWDEFK